MKKKLWLIILVMILSIGGILLGKSLQKKVITEEMNVENTSSNDNISKNSASDSKTVVETPSKPVEQPAKTSNSNNTSQSKETEKNKETNNQASAARPVKSEDKAVSKEEPNFIVTDTITGKVILSKRVAFKEETVAKITMDVLNSSKIDYRTNGFGSSVYFSAIGGLKERGAGELSGWCYYVNNKKISVGAGSYKVSSNDTIEWKYLKDGISN